MKLHRLGQLHGGNFYHERSKKYLDLSKNKLRILIGFLEVQECRFFKEEVYVLATVGKELEAFKKWVKFEIIYNRPININRRWVRGSYRVK